MDARAQWSGVAHLGPRRGGGADEQPRADVVCGSEELARWVVWTHLGKDFVCLEPWTAAANALDTGERLLVIEPGGERVLSVSISLEW